MASRGASVQSAAVRRNLIFVGVCLVTLLVFGPILKNIVSLGLRDDRYLQIAVAPFACAMLLFFRRIEIFSRAAFSPHVGIPLVSSSVVLGTFGVHGDIDGKSGGLVLSSLLMILLWIAVFVLCCGTRSFRAALYPLCTLFLMIPLPSSWMDRVSMFLQYGSAAIAYRMLLVAGIPVFRHGMVFSLPGLEFEVAPECSGLHSSLALMMVAIVAAYLCLRSGWSRAVLLALTIPVALVKNAIRIAVIGGLGARVDRAFIDGPFHHQYGGVVFSVIAVVLFVLILGGLQAVERHWRSQGANVA